MNIPKLIPHDKALHALGGALLAAVLYPALLYIGAHQALTGTLILVVGVGLIKEVYDAAHADRHTADFMDALATILGGLLVTLPVYLTR